MVFRIVNSRATLQGEAVSHARSVLRFLSGAVSVLRPESGRLLNANMTLFTLRLHTRLKGRSHLRNFVVGCPTGQITITGNRKDAEPCTLAARRRLPSRSCNRIIWRNPSDGPLPDRPGRAGPVTLIEDPL